jgi:L-alanine-DL-glutamate epimerase-like enolase superfamily enzyme
MWRLFLRVVPVLRARQQIEPNVAIALSALMLDLGMAPARCGPFLSLMMAHNYAAHALEAADHDGPWLQVIPDDAIEDRSPPLRRSPAAAAAAPRGPGSIGPRRSLPW